MSATTADMTFPEHRRRISAEQRLEIRQRYRAGDLLTDIAKDYGVTQSAISYHVRDIHDERASKARTSLDIERLKQLAEEGLDRIQIGAELGCSRKTVSKVAKAHGIALTPARSNQTALKPVAARKDPAALTGGRWVTGRHGIKRWQKD